MKRMLVRPLVWVMEWTCWVIDWPPLNKRLPATLRRFGCPGGLTELAFRLDERYSPRTGAGREV